MCIGVFWTRLLFISAVSSSLIACGGGGGSEPAAPQTYTVSVNVSGLSGTGLTLSNNGTDNLNIAGNSRQSFSSTLESSDDYAVTITSQPTSPAQVCTVADGNGTVANANINNINIDCVTNTYTVSVNVSDLAGSGLVLQNNSADNLLILGNGTETFLTSVTDGTDYDVSVLAQPIALNQTCSITNGTGTLASADVTNVDVDCVTNTYPINVAASGLAGTGLVLQNNAGDNLAVTSNNQYTFSAEITDGGAYNVSVLSQPNGLSQTCVVSNPANTINGTAPTNIGVACTTNTYPINVAVSGLAGSGLVLQNNAGDNLTVASNGQNTFTGRISDGGGYSVSVLTSPSNLSQSCVVSNATSTVNGTAPTNIGVACTTNTYPINVTVNGLDGAGLVLQNNSGDNLAIASGGQNTFSAEIQDGDNYNVSVLTQPTSLSQTCAVNNPSNTIIAAPPTNISVDCVTDQFTVGGSITGLAGSVTLQNSGGDDLVVTAGSTSFTFDAAVTDGDAYLVSVLADPIAPNQSCSITSGASGNIAGAPVTSVTIACENAYLISGTVSGLNGAGLQISDGVEILTIAGNGVFTFSDLLLTGDNYSVTLVTEATGPNQECVVSNGSGVVTSIDITNITVNCMNTVEALYVSGQDWNDYVQNDGGDIYTASDAACVGSNTGGYSTCLHGGEMRAFEVSGQASCAGLSATDNLNAFDWQCVATNPDVTMVSTGLRDGVYLSDLIDWTSMGWRTDSVTVSNGGGTVLTTADTVWWSNPIIENNVGGSLATPGAIYAVTLNPNTKYVLDTSKVGLVVKPGVTISNSTAGNFDSVVGTANNPEFIWYEGDVDGVGAQWGIDWRWVRHSVVRNVYTHDANANGILLFESNNNKLVDINSSNNGLISIWVNQSSYNTLNNIEAYDNVASGIQITGPNADYNVVDNLIASGNSGGSGIYISSANAIGNRISNVIANNNNRGVSTIGTGTIMYNLSLMGNTVFGAETDNATDAIIVNATIGNSTNEGLRIDSTDSVFMNVTSTNNRNLTGIYLTAARNNVIMNASTVNSGQGIYFLSNVTGNTFTNLLSTNNHTFGMRMGSQIGNVFSGELKLGNNPSGDCEENVANICPTVFTVGVDSTDSFVGKVIRNDVANISDTSGKSVLSGITDFTYFDNLYRGWGKDGSAFPNIDNRGHCGNVVGDTDLCRIWDWRLSSLDTANKGIASVIPTGNDTLTHTWSDTSITTFLNNASEVMGDGVGNDNGLCESDETCLFTPNIGSYQGHGNLISAGVFTDGTITGVTLLKYETNGVVPGVIGLSLHGSTNSHADARRGTDCMDCHTSGPGTGIFVTSGTSATDIGGYVEYYADFARTDLRARLEVDAYGNFYTVTPIDILTPNAGGFSQGAYITTVAANGARRNMTGVISHLTATCNVCHSGTGIRPAL